MVHLEGAQAVAAFGSDYYKGKPALTRHRFGEGEAWYAATDPSRGRSNRTTPERSSRSSMNCEIRYPWPLRSAWMLARSSQLALFASLKVDIPLLPFHPAGAEPASLAESGDADDGAGMRLPTDGTAVS